MPHYERTYPVPDRDDLSARDRVLAWLRYFSDLEPEDAEKLGTYPHMVAVIEAAERHGRASLAASSAAAETLADAYAFNMGEVNPYGPPASVFEELPPKRIELDEETAKLLALAFKGRKPEGEGA